MSSHTAKTMRSSASAATAGRLDQEVQRLEHLEEMFDAEDSLQSLMPEQIKDKLSREQMLPSGFQTTMVDGMLLIYLLNVVDGMPEVQASITVRPDLAVIFSYSMEKKEIPTRRYKDLKFLTTCGLCRN